MDIKPINLENLLTIADDYMDYFNTYEEAVWTKDKVERKLTQLVNRFDYVGIGLFSGNQLIGFAVGQLLQFDDGLIAVLNELFVSKSYQSKGYGSKLLKEFERLVKEQGAFRIQLESANDEIHHRFYNVHNGYKNATNNISKAKALD